MQSQAVEFELNFPARRQLQSVQTSAVDPSSAAFQLQLQSALAASFSPPIGDERVLISSTSDARTLKATIIGFESAAQSPASIVSAASTSAFISALEAALGVSVLMPQPPALIMRTTPAPSPPPSPSTPASPIFGEASSLENLETTSANAGGLSTEMLWVIISSVIVFLIITGCLCAYLLGKRSGKQATSVVHVGRPALRRQVTPEEQQQRGGAAAASSAVPGPQGDAAANVRVDDVRLLELGMAVERAKASAASSRTLTPGDVAIMKLDAVQAAVDDVRDTLSPRSPNAMRVADTRISKSVILDTVV